ncbi:APC family permease [Eggerthella sinensis]|uniref:Amino acid permease n=1 Tax=Eggerthella sinensis TaxID=242230 RepID=A0A3N0IY24_9ACTN|nr:APC family permease [Eggerthella sinensis]RDB67700.1 amino acid permease [Eggerthella sinensis]RNM41883.1 amino acid permease [Eggerthella sinensis]
MTEEQKAVASAHDAAGSRESLLQTEAEASEAALEAMGYKQELKRAMSVPDMLVYGLIFMVPIAPFGIYGGVFGDSGGMPALVYLVGMIAMIFTAFSYATLSQAFPVSGSVYGYTSRGINKPVGFVTGWTMLLDYLLVPTLLYVVAAQAMSGIVPEVPALIWGILFVAINTFVNIRGIELTVIVNRVAVVLEILCLAVFVIMGALWIATDPLSNGFTIQPFYNPETFNPGLVMSAVSLGVLSFLGFDGIATLSEEAKDAKKGPSKAMVGSLLIVGFLFMLQTYIAGCISPDGAVFASDPDNAFYLVAEVAGGKFLYVLCALATAIAWGIFNSLAAQTAISRILFAMSRDGNLPKALAKVHPKYQTPYIAAAFVGVLSLILVIVFEQLGIDAISRLVNFGALTSFCVLHVTVVWHFFIKNRDGKVFTHLVLPLLGFIIVGYTWISLDPASKIMGVTWVVVGIVYYVVLHKVMKKNVDLEV